MSKSKLEFLFQAKILSGYIANGMLCCEHVGGGTLLHVVVCH